MRIVELVSATLKTIRQNQPVVEGGHPIHIQMQKKGFEAAIQTTTVSLAHAVNQNSTVLMQQATIDFLRAEGDRLWNERKRLVKLMSESRKESARMASKGYVSKSDEMERDIANTLDRQVTIVGEKIAGIRIALDHAIHAGGDIFKERALQFPQDPNCYRPSVYGKDYGLTIVDQLD